MNPVFLSCLLFGFLFCLIVAVCFVLQGPDFIKPKARSRNTPPPVVKENDDSGPEIGVV